jgi:hypothetical protein
MNKKFISTKFFLTLKEAIQKGIDVDIRVLEPEYETFACLLFDKTAESSDKAVFIIHYVIRVLNLQACKKQQGIEKKYVHLAGQNY